MARTRKDVWGFVQIWDDTLLWYAKAVAVMQSRPITDRTSWSYLAAMHGFDAAVWQDAGYLAAGEALPDAADQDKFWAQCQHQSWYFLPWHRGYISAFEGVVRAAIIGLDGPVDWALPYWNYSDQIRADALKLPAAFSEPTLPDGSANPLNPARRFGDGSGVVVIDPQDVVLDALRETQFVADGVGGTAGFGGPESLFQHFSDRSGRLESTPHNIVHVRIGGRDPASPDPSNPIQGLMTDPNTAGLDPIFWLHHANIDRLWEVWLQRDTANLNPTDVAWLNGPSDRTFVMPDLHGNPVTFAAADMLDTTAANLDYVYEDTADPIPGPTIRNMRLTKMAAPPQLLTPAAEAAVSKAPVTELMGANATSLALSGGVLDIQVALDHAVTLKAAASFDQKAMVASTAKAPDRVFLNLENIRGNNDAIVFQVYVDLPHGADPATHQKNLAGVVGLFGVTKASKADGPHGGGGLHEVLEITHVIDALHIRTGLAVKHLDVRFVPRTALRPEDNISIGRVSVYRSGD